MSTDPHHLDDEFSEPEGLDLRNQLQEAHGTHPRGWFHWLFDRIHPLPGQRILDLGCGTGDFWVENQRRLWDDWFILLCDRSPAMLAEAAGRLRPAGGSILYALLDAQDLSFSPGSFDTVMAVGLFDILTDPPRAFAEIHRLLRTGGRLYATAGTRNHLAEFAGLLEGILPRSPVGGLTDRFGLENAAEQLSPWFDQLEVHRYADQLVFDQPQPVMEYLLSESAVSNELEADERALLEERIRARLARGAFTVRREKGVVIGERRLDLGL